MESLKTHLKKIAEEEHLCYERQSNVSSHYLYFDKMEYYEIFRSPGNKPEYCLFHWKDYHLLKSVILGKRDPELGFEPIAENIKKMIKKKKKEEAADNCLCNKCKLSEACEYYDLKIKECEYYEADE